MRRHRRLRFFPPEKLPSINETKTVGEVFKDFNINPKKDAIIVLIKVLWNSQRLHLPYETYENTPFNEAISSFVANWVAETEKSGASTPRTPYSIEAIDKNSLTAARQYWDPAQLSSVLSPELTKSWDLTP